MTAECPICEGKVSLGSDIVAGELVECPECGTELEIKAVDPVKLDEAPAAQEDWGE